MKSKLIITTLIIIGSLAAFSAIWYSKRPVSLESPNPADPIAESVQVKTDTVSYPKGIAEDLNKINLAASKLDNIKITNAFSIVTRYIDNKEELGSYTFTLSRKGKNIRYETPEILRVQDEKYNVMVYGGQKMILVFDPDQDLGVYMKQTLKNFNPDTALAFADKVEAIASDKEERAYAFYYSFMPYDKLEIHFNTKTYLISKVVYYYSEDKTDEDILSQIVTMNTTYEKFSKLPIEVFQTSNYFSLKQKELIPTPAFSGYAVYNNMKK